MRILTFLHSFDPGGVERIALRLVREWRGLGVDAPLFLGRTDGAMRADVGLGVEFGSPRQPWFGTAWWETLWMIATLPRVVLRTRPDVLFCAGNTYAVVAVAMKLLLRRRCPAIVLKVSNDLDRNDLPRWRRSAYGLWLRAQARFLDHIVVMEASAADEVRERMGTPPERITVVPDPALSTGLIERLRSTPPAAADRQGRRFVSVGRLSPQKNVSLMLRAFERGAGPQDRLEIIGDGPERPKLERLARRLGLDGRVVFRGYVTEPVLFMPGFDALLLTSNYEGVPAVVLEAMAANLWVISTDCSRSMGSLVRDGKLGRLVPVGDVEAMAKAIESTPAGGQDEGLSLEQARRFTIEHAAECYLDAAAQAIRDASGSRPASVRPASVFAFDR